MENKNRNSIFKPRILNYWLNISLIVVTASLIIWRGPQLFQNTSSPSLFRMILTILTMVLFLIVVFVTHRSRGNTLLTAIFRSVFIAVTAFGLTFLIGNVLQIKEPDTFNSEITSLVEKANILMEKGEFTGSEVLGRQCVEIAKEPQEIKVCNKIVADADFEIAQLFANSGDCILAGETLSKGLAAAEVIGDSNMIGKFSERADKYKVSCIVEPTPTPLPDRFIAEIIRVKKGADDSLFDLRVLNNDTYVTDFTKTNFKVLDKDSDTLYFDFENKSSDDPVCVVAVIDNSWSVLPGIESIRNAVRSLNEMRKPNDEIGLVTIGNTGKTQIVFYPQKSLIDITKIDGKGGNTALWRGVELGLEAANKCESSDKYLILLTDGSNTELFEKSKTDLKAIEYLLEVAREGDVNICPVGIKSEELDETSLEMLSEGCNYNLAEDFDAISQKFTSIFGYVRNFYRIRFSTKSMGSDNSIKIQLLKDSVQVGDIDVEFGK